MLADREPPSHCVQPSPAPLPRYWYAGGWALLVVPLFLLLLVLCCRRRITTMMIISMRMMGPGAQQHHSSSAAPSKRRRQMLSIHHIKIQSLLACFCYYRATPPSWCSSPLLQRLDEHTKQQDEQ